jgi:hypothetical protein
MNKAIKFIDGDVATKLFQTYLDALMKMFKSKEEEITAKNEKVSEE